MPRGRNRTTRRHTRHKKARSPVKNGTACRKQIPFQFQGRSYMIVIAGRETEAYTVIGKGSTLRKVRDFKEKHAVFSAFNKTMEAAAEARDKKARKKRAEALS